jgi:sodium-dependent dicarboxylate transporter 2/3/5
MLGACALLGMWVSNTAGAAMMAPVAVTVVALVTRGKTGDASDHERGIAADRVDQRNLATALVLAVAYGSAIGGVATLIGTPPNGIAARFIADNYGVEISFLTWLAIGLPVAVLFLPVIWFVLARVAFRSRLGPVEGGRAFLQAELRKLGPLGKDERVVLAVLLTTIALWITRPWLAAARFGETQPFAALTDPGIAMAAALALFLLPVPGKSGARVMDWPYATQLPWGVLILFGGGLSLAAATQATGVADFVGSLTRYLGGLPDLAIVLAVVTIACFATEIMSGTALVALLLPLLSAAAPGFGVPPEPLLLAATLAANLAFMMPVATPPNAVVFGTGLVTIGQMVRAGAILNVLLVAFVTAYAYLVLLPLFAVLR